MKAVHGNVAKSARNVRQHPSASSVLSPLVFACVLPPILLLGQLVKDDLDVLADW